MRGIKSDIWHMQNNSADSLLAIVGVQRQQEILEQMEDFFGRNMLEYKMESRKKPLSWQGRFICIRSAGTTIYIPISILVPAHNEETTVVDTVCTLLRQEYPLYEIVVVDDGSTDHTAENLISYFRMI